MSKWQKYSIRIVEFSLLAALVYVTDWEALGYAGGFLLGCLWANNDLAELRASEAEKNKKD